MLEKIFSKKKNSGDREEFNILSEFGNQTFITLSEQLYKNDSSVFSELISNSIDAKAKKINIDFRPEEICFFDDGEGLDGDSLKRFLSINISKKNTKEEFNKNIGMFGLGTISIRRIAKAYKIESYKDGFYYTGEFDFEKLEKLGNLNDIQTPIQKNNNESNITSGVRITLKKLKRNFSKEDIRNLQQNISFDLPLEQIKVYVNNKFTKALDYYKILGNVGGVKNIKKTFREVDLNKNEINFRFDFVTEKLFLEEKEVRFIPKVSKNQKPLERFVKDENLSKELGVMYGKILYSENPLPENMNYNFIYGLKVKILGRTVTSNNDFISYRNVAGKGFWDNRVCGFVNCDSLKKIIKISRGDLDDESPLFKKFKFYFEKIYIRITNRVNEDDSSFRKIEREKDLLLNNITNLKKI